MSSNRPLRIAHLTVYRELPSGIRNQLRYESHSSERLVGATWHSLAVHNGTIREVFERSIPWPLRGIFLRNLYGWLLVLKMRRHYDFILLRHMPFDPFALLFSPLVANRVSVHHSKEVEELPLIRPGLSGRLAALLEAAAGRIAVRSSVAILGVTSEIAKYERDTRALGKPTSVYPNGIELAEIELASESRSRNEVNVVFIADTFSEWHGLDRLVDALAQASVVPEGLCIHLVGRLSDTLLARVSALGARGVVVQVHGFLEADAYRRILDKSDVGIGSLAMDRQNLREGSTLKVREMLAAGIPVYSGHVDTALPATFPFYRMTSEVDILELHSFAMEMKGVKRQEVRDAAANYIEKTRYMQNVVDWLEETFPNREAR